MRRWWLLIGLCACGSERPEPEPPSLAMSQGLHGEVRCAEAPYDGYRGCVGTGYGQPLRIWYRNEMGTSFGLVGAAIGIDRRMVFDSNDAELLGNDALPIFEGRISPQPHLLSVVLHIQGRGSGVFSYLKGYRFQVKSHCMLDTRAADTRVQVAGIERGGPTTPLEQRPGVRFDVRHDQGHRMGRCLD